MRSISVLGQGSGEEDLVLPYRFCFTRKSLRYDIIVASLPPTTAAVMSDEEHRIDDDDNTTLAFRGRDK